MDFSALGGTNIWLLLALLVVFVLGVYVVPQWRFKRSVRQVVAVFRKNSATDSSNAKTLEELGFYFQRSFMQQLLRGRDYRSHALSALLKAKIVEETQEGKLFLIEEKVPPAYR